MMEAISNGLANKTFKNKKLNFTSNFRDMPDKASSNALSDRHTLHRQLNSHALPDPKINCTAL